MSDLPAMPYGKHLFLERDLRTVTANTRAGGAALLRLATTLRITATVTPYPFAHTDRALQALRSGDASGSLVVSMS